MIIQALREFFQRRRFRKDFHKMADLTDRFVISIRDLAKKDGYEAALNPIEVLVLGTFLVAEIYLSFSRNQALTSGLLDFFHKFAAERLFNRNIALLQAKFASQDIDAMYDDFMKSFYEKVEERYPEYRSVMLDERGLFKDSDSPLFEVGKHLLKPSFDIDADARRAITFAFGVAVLDHMRSSTDSLKH